MTNIKSNNPGKVKGFNEGPCPRPTAAWTKDQIESHGQTVLTLGSTGLVANPKRKERSKAPAKTITKKKDLKVKKSSNSKGKVQFATDIEEIEPWVPAENIVYTTGKPAPEVQEGEEPCIILRSC